jgi:hypothetical protein
MTLWLGVFSACGHTGRPAESYPASSQTDQEAEPEPAPASMSAELATEAALPMSESASRAAPAPTSLTRARQEAGTVGGAPLARRPPPRLAAVVPDGRRGSLAGSSGGAVQVVGAEARQPVLIFTAELTMATFEVATMPGKLDELARELGGFVAQQTNASMTMRVPVARFREAITRVEKLGDIVQRNINAEDVSQEYFDLEVRIRSARAVRERLEGLLARAVKVEDAISVERELDRVVGEIERLEGRLKYLQDRAQYSTIKVGFAAQPHEVVGKETFKLPFPWLDQLGLRRLLELDR